MRSARQQTAPPPVLEAGPLALDRLSVRLTTEESRDIELILLSRIMHRRGAAMGVETLRSRSPCVFRYRIARPAFRMTSGRALLWTLELRRRPCGAWHGSHRWRFALRSPAKANRSQPLHQRHAPLFGMIVVEFTTLRPNFVLRRQRQFIDSRHARGTRVAFRRRRNVRRRHLRLRDWRFGL